MKSIKLLATVAALLAPLSAAHAVQGLAGKYFTGQNYPNPTTGTPSATFLTNTVCFPNCGVDIGDGTTLSTFLGVPLGYTSNLSQDFIGVANHSLTLSGQINILTGGAHSFGLYSDDASLLYIDGVLVVNNGGQHAPQTVTTLGYNLTAGWHDILIYQDENGGGTALTAYFDGNPLSGAILANNVPEPAAWGLMLGGFGVIGAATRRRRAAAAIA